MEKEDDKENTIMEQQSPDKEASTLKRKRQMSASDGSAGNKENEGYKNSRTTLNYREFLTKIVKFKKVIPLTYDKPKPETDNIEKGSTSQVF